eukprot:COSAG04_NODE_20900_length_384_cov_0.547368_1_plen_60_part_10
MRLGWSVSLGLRQCQTSVKFRRHEPACAATDTLPCKWNGCRPGLSLRKTWRVVRCHEQGW